MSKLTSIDGAVLAMMESYSSNPAQVEELEDHYRVFVELPKFITATDNKTGLDISIDPAKPCIEAAKGRLGNRLFDCHLVQKGVIFKVYYAEKESGFTDARNWAVQKVEGIGQKYTTKQKQVEAVFFAYDNQTELLEFTGGGQFSKMQDTLFLYSFDNGFGLIKTAFEGQYLLRNEKGLIQVMDKTEFESTYAFNSEITRADIKDLFDKEFGMGLHSRFRKLREEYYEVTEARSELLKADSAPEAEAATLHLEDELGDLYAVLFHIMTLLEVEPETLLQKAYQKVLKRLEDPAKEAARRKNKADQLEILRIVREYENNSNHWPDGGTAIDDNGIKWGKVKDGWLSEEGLFAEILKITRTTEIIVSSKVNKII